MARAQLVDDGSERRGDVARRDDKGERVRHPLDRIGGVAPGRAQRGDRACAAALGSLDRDRRPRRGRAADGPSLPVDDVDVREHLEVLERLDSLGADRRVDAPAVAHERLDERRLDRVGAEIRGT